MDIQLINLPCQRLLSPAGEAIPSPLKSLRLRQLHLALIEPVCSEFPGWRASIPHTGGPPRVDTRGASQLCHHFTFGTCSDLFMNGSTDRCAPTFHARAPVTARCRERAAARLHHFELIRTGNGRASVRLGERA